MNFYQHHIGDYSKDTVHLSMLEDSAYRRMLDVYYGTEKPLPKAQQSIYRLVRARTRAEQLAVDVVLGEFFTEGPDGWHNKRADEEIAKALSEGEEARGKRENEVERQRRHRERRKQVFEALRTYGEVPKWDAGMEELETLLKTLQSRTRNAPVTPPVTRTATANHYPLPITQTPEEQKLSAAPAAEVPDGTPDCPHERLIALYHELLPTCPRVEEWNDTRRAMMRARWREKAKPNGKTQGYTTTEAGLAYWRVYFSYIADSRFLTGQEDGRQGRPPFLASLEWLIKPTNFAKVVEGNYHR